MYGGVGDFDNRTTLMNREHRHEFVYRLFLKNRQLSGIRFRMNPAVEMINLTTSIVVDNIRTLIPTIQPTQEDRSNGFASAMIFVLLALIVCCFLVSEPKRRYQRIVRQQDTILRRQYEQSRREEFV
jgi:hypothetical protein